MGLERYRQKRNFRETPEPPGEVAGGGGSRLLVLKPQGSALPYAFLLGVGGGV